MTLLTMQDLRDRWRVTERTIYKIRARYPARLQAIRLTKRTVRFRLVQIEAFEKWRSKPL